VRLEKRLMWLKKKLEKRLVQRMDVRLWQQLGKLRVEEQQGEQPVREARNEIHRTYPL
jgi:hypothetical protein